MQRGVQKTKAYTVRNESYLPGQIEQEKEDLQIMIKPGAQGLRDPLREHGPSLRIPDWHNERSGIEGQLPSLAAGTASLFG